MNGVLDVGHDRSVNLIKLCYSLIRKLQLPFVLFDSQLSKDNR